MNTSLATLAVIVGAYLVGSISFAVVVSKLFRLPDPRSYGSGNPGATNVLRSGNRLAAALTLAGDCVKGWFAVWLAYRLGASWGEGSVAAAGAALAVLLGHVYPVFHRFVGGKGVATAAGVALALSWQLGLVLAGVWLAVALLFRMSSLASLTAAVVAPPIGLYLLGSCPEAWALFPIALLLIWRHRTNVSKILSGHERRIGS